MSNPYVEFEHTPAWTAIATAISELESNQDLHLTTNPVYVIGYLCQQLAAKDIASNTDRTAIMKLPIIPPPHPSHLSTASSRFNDFRRIT